MPAPNRINNPTVPVGYKLMAQLQVTHEMSAWAVEILRNPTYELFASATKTFGTVTVLARVELHSPDFQNHVVHRGVTLYEPVHRPVDLLVHATGVDVSGYQPHVNWAEVTASGVAFAFIKATEAATLVDHAFADHWGRAKNAGLLRGAYHFLRPKQDAVAQAQFFLAQLADRGELPPVLDVEVADGVPLPHIAAGVSTWLDHVVAKLGRAIVYASPGFWNLLPLIPNIATQADLWVANWGAASPMKVNGWQSWTFWQYTNKATIAGVPGTGAMDENRFNGSPAELKAYSDAFVRGLPAPTSFTLDTTFPQTCDLPGCADQCLAESGSENA